MIARIRKSIEEKDKGDKGFTLIELLVVIIIIGILAAIAIPIFLNQRKKAVDAAAEADLTTIAKQVATYLVDQDADSLSVGQADGSWTFTVTPTGGTAETVTVGPVSRPSNFAATSVAVTPASDITAANFDLKLTYTGGTKTSVTYDAAKGLTTAGSGS